MRTRINLHTVRDDTLLGTLKFVSKIEDYQKYGALIPNEMINQDIKDSKAYKTYLDFATGKATPKKARKFKKVVSPSKKLSPVLEEEPAKKPKQAKKPAKKSTIMPTAGVIVKDTPSVSVTKKKAPAKVDRGKGMDLLSEAALLEATQLKEALKKSEQDSHMLHASSSGDGVGFEPKVPDESEDKTTGTNEGSSTKPGVPDVPKDQSESENKYWGDIGDDDRNDDVSNDDDDDDDADSNDDADNDASDSERSDSDEEENPTLNLKNDEEEETHDDEYIHTPYYYAPTDEETNDDYREFDEEDYEELHKHKTEGSMQSSSISSDFANKFLNLDNVSPADNEVASLMNVKVCHEESSTQAPSLLTVPVTVIMETRGRKKSVTEPTPPARDPLDVETIKRLQQRIQELEGNPRFYGKHHDNPLLTKETKSEPIIWDVGDEEEEYPFVNKHPSFEEEPIVWVLSVAPSKSIDDDSVPSVLPRSYTAEFEKKAQAEKDRYIDLIEKSIKDIIKDEVKSKLPQILPKEISDFATPVIQSTINESLKNVRYHEDKNKDEDPPAGSDQGLKKQKTNKDAKPSKGVPSLSQNHLNNPEAQEYLFDLSKPLPLIQDRGRQVVPIDYFINNDLEHLKDGSSSRKYMTSTTKTKAAKYDNV
ncbi:hypothetical protein Tco_0555970 [Tanacetum coccineum]